MDLKKLRMASYQRKKKISRNLQKLKKKNYKI